MPKKTTRTRLGAPNPTPAPRVVASVRVRTDDHHNGRLYEIVRPWRGGLGGYDLATDEGVLRFTGAECELVGAVPTPNPKVGDRG